MIVKNLKGSSSSFAVMPFGQQGAVADLLFVEPSSSSGKRLILELGPHI